MGGLPRRAFEGRASGRHGPHTGADTERCVLAAGRGVGQVSLADRAWAHLPPAGSMEVAALNHHGDLLGDTLDRPSLGSPA